MSNPFHYLQSIFPETTRTLNFGSNELEWLEAFLANLTVTTRATVPTPVNATDATTKAYVDALFNPTVATIQEADGSPSVTNPTTLRFDQADGFVITVPTTGIARVDLDDIPYAAIQNVSTTDRLLGRETAGAGVIEEIVCTAAGRALLDDASAAAQRTTLGSTTVGDALFITTSAAAARTTLGSTTVGDAVFIAASAAAARTTLGLVIGTDVQAWDADLDALAALAATAGMLSRTGAGAFTARTLTGTANRITVADGTGAAGNPTFDVGTDVYTVGGTDVAVGDGGTALSSGTSGGVLAFTGATTLASSAALLASAVVLGGGAGAVPATMTDPGADRLIFWDESANATVYLTAGTGLTITDTTITAATAESGTWSDVSASRAYDTVYQNTSGKKRRVASSVQVNSGAQERVDVQVGSANPPTIEIMQNVGTAQGLAGWSGNFAISFEVPNNWYYRLSIVNGTPGFQGWGELDE